MKSFNTEQANCFVKRDDELGFGISGSKMRKYRSLIPFFLQNSIQEVIVIGGSHSNNVLGIIQLLIENNITPTLFLKRNHAKEIKGNLLFTLLFVPESSIHWIDSKDWNNVEKIAEAYAKTLSHTSFVLKEGSSVAEALPGALSLPFDIIKNEKENGIHFDHLFVDAGTGMMASALILGFHALQKKTTIHTILLADDIEAFLEQLHHFHKIYREMKGTPLSFPENFKMYKPSSGASFGSLNEAVFQEIVDLARLEGFLTDPVYTAKLFKESRRIIKEDALKGNVLVIHSGGGLGLCGFQDTLKERLIS